jgi:uncharacterized protein with gpF-like domain
MMRYDLAAIVRRNRKLRRRVIVLRPITAPATFAGNLYRAGYSEVIQAWTAAIDPIIAAYEQTLSELTRDSPEQIGAQVSAVEASVAAVVLTVRARLEQWAASLERFHRQKWRGAVLSATQVDVDTLIGPADMRIPMSAAIERNVGLISSVSQETRTRIGERVFAGLQRRAPAREVAAEIREAVGMGRRRALNIASDQTVKLASALNEERRREAGISLWEWVSSHKLHYRVVHHERNGNRYDDDVSSGAHKPPADRPGMLPYCGCTSRAVLSLTGEF